MCATCFPHTHIRHLHFNFGNYQHNFEFFFENAGTLKNNIMIVWHEYKYIIITSLRTRDYELHTCWSLSLIRIFPLVSYSTCLYIKYISMLENALLFRLDLQYLWIICLNILFHRGWIVYMFLYFPMVYVLHYLYLYLAFTVTTNTIKLCIYKILL